MGSRPHGLGNTLAVTLLGVAVALATVSYELALGCAVLAAVAALGALSLQRPRIAVASAIPILLVAATDFRSRDPSAAIAGQVDAQIWLELGLYAAAGCVALRWYFLHPIRLSANRGILGLALFGGMAVLSATWSPIPMLTLVRALQWWVIIAVAGTVTSAFSVRESVDLFGWSCVGYVLLFTSIRLAFPGLVSLNDPTPVAFERFTWFAVHPAVAALLAGMGAIYLVARLLEGGADRQPRPGLILVGAAALLGAAALFGVVLATRARTELAALALVVPAMVLHRATRPGLFVAASLLLGLAGIGVLLALEPVLDIASGSTSETAAVQFLLREQTLEEFRGLTGRVELWGQLLPLVSEKPLFGSGYMASRLIVLERVPWASYAHNGPLQSLLDLGVVGTLVVWFFALRATVVSALAVEARASRGPLVAFALLMFLVLVSVTGDGIAAAPGPHILAFALAVAVSDSLGHPMQERGEA